MDRETHDAVEQALSRFVESRQWSEYSSYASTSLIAYLGKELERTFVDLICSGTIGIELALRGLGVGANDLVMLAGYDYPGNFRAIEMVGAKPWLVDLKPNRWTLSLASILEATAEHQQLPKAVVVSHLHGSMADMAAITAWAKENSVGVVEDACQAHGAMIAGKPAGSWGDVSVLSFGGSKLITSGRGGAVLTNDERIRQRMTVYRERGNDAFAMSELQACVLLPQWESLAQQTQERWESVQWLEHRLRESGLRFANREGANGVPAFYKWAFQVLGANEEEASQRRESVLHRLQQFQIRAGIGFLGFHKRSHVRCLRPANLDEAARAASSTVVIHHSHLRSVSAENALDRIVEALTDF